MNPSDDSTVAHSIHPIAAALINAPKNPGSLIPRTPPKSPNDPTVSAGVQSLESLFAPSLTPTEVAFHTPVRGDSVAPKNFLQAHMIIIDQLLMDPMITTTKLAHVTGYSTTWLHKVMNSDAFQAKLGERQKALCDPIILSTIKDRLQGVTSRALEVLEERLEGDKVSGEFALSVIGATAKALGLGQSKNAPVLQQQFLIHVPVPQKDANAWAAEHSGRVLPTAEPALLAGQGDSAAVSATAVADAASGATVQGRAPQEVIQERVRELLDGGSAEPRGD